MSYSVPNILGKITPTQFLKHYWQKKPLLIRQAIPEYLCPISPQELAGLACEDSVESRLIIEKGGSRPWQVKHGPLTTKDFKTLPATHWTLLVHRVDCFDTRITALLDHFRFIPNWRIDDVMISYAPKYGSVGPHLDSYDVFLLQGMGRRRWQINTSDYSAADFMPDLDLRILKKFRKQQEWILEPGDMLYLPPGIAHHGVALEPCLTLSVGFLAPACSELLTHFAEDVIAHGHRDARYSDPGLTLQKHPGEITRQHIDRVQKLMESALQDKATLAQWFGKYSTHQSQDIIAPKHPLTVTGFKRLLRKKGSLKRLATRCAWIKQKQHILLYVNGVQYCLEPGDLAAVKLLTSTVSVSHSALAACDSSTAFMKLLCTLYNQGIFTFD